MAGICRAAVRHEDKTLKTIITTDVHGCSLELRALLKKAELDRCLDHLIILGDLFDRGKHSYEVFSMILHLKEEMGDRFTLIRGNHDQLLLDYAEDNGKMLPWSFNGGVKTIESFARHGLTPKDAVPLLKDTPLFLETDRFIAVHAGLRSDHPEENDPETFLWDRGVTYGEYRGRKLGIGGHTPMRSPVWFTGDGQPLELPYDKVLALPDRGFICLDTGCVFGFKLTGMVITEDEFRLISVSKKDY